MRSMKCAAALAAIAAPLLLAACGGGSSTGSGEARDLASAAAFNPAATRDAAGAAAVADPQYGPQVGSVFQAASSSAATAATFDGSRLSLSVAGTLDLNSEDHSRGGTSFETPLDGHTGQSWGMAGATATGMSAATVFVSWNSANAADWLAFGYWLHATGNPRAETVTSAAAGAFIDGPEFAERTAAMPTSGFASYRGIVGGIYSYGSAGNVEVEEALGVIDISADFRPGKAIVWGNIFEIGGDGVTIQLDFASYTANGRINPADVDVATDHGNTVLQSVGKWGGRFSIKDDGGEPRAIGGTVGADWTDGGNRNTFIGAFVASKQ